MDDVKYLTEFGNSAAMIVHASEHLKKVINEDSYRQILKSPNQTEYLFEEDDRKKVAELRKLKKELDDTIEDLADELSPGVRALNESTGWNDIRNYYEPLIKSNIRY